MTTHRDPEIFTFYECRSPHLGIAAISAHDGIIVDTPVWGLCFEDCATYRTYAAGEVFSTWEAARQFVRDHLQRRLYEQQAVAALRGAPSTSSEIRRMAEHLAEVIAAKEPPPFVAPVLNVPASVMREAERESRLLREAFPGRPARARL